METKVITMERGRHLYTSKTGYPIEVVFVTLVSTTKATIQPEAGFYSSLTYQMVTLFSQSKATWIIETIHILKLDFRVYIYSSDDHKDFTIRY